MNMINKCAKFHKDSPKIKKLNSISRARLNFRRRPILCTTLYRNLMQASNFGGTFDQLFLGIFLWNFHRRCLNFFYTMVEKKSKMTKNSNQRGGGGPVLTLCEATAGSTKLRKKAILPERLLSEKRSDFAYYNLTLSESFCLTDHEKQVQKFVAHWKVCQKSSQREVIRKNAYKAPKPQRVLLPALLLKFSRSLTNFQASPGRQSSLRSKDRCPNHAVV